MASSAQINGMAAIDEGVDVPQWKKELMVNRKTYGRTISSASGSIKFVVTCPKAMRPKIKKQISSSKEASKTIRNDIIQKEKEVILINKFKDTLKFTEELTNQKNSSAKLPTILLDDPDTRNITTEDFPKPGLVQTLKSKYLSMMKEGENTERIEKRSVSFDNVLESKNPFHEIARRKSMSMNEISIEPVNEEYPRPSTVSSTKQLFENIEKPVQYNNFSKNTNPFIKPPLMPKPLVKPRRNKPPLPPNKPVLSPERTFGTNPFYNGLTSPTSPVKSGRNLY